MSTIQESTIRFLEEHDSFWRWKGHKHVAELASGKLSDFYANCTPIFTYPELQDLIAEELVLMTSGEQIVEEKSVWVIGSAMGAIGLAQSLARQFVAGAAFTERVMPVLEGPAMELKRFDLGEKPYVILCEDVVTTGGTTRKTMVAIQEKHPAVRFHEDVLVIVNRSGKHHVGIDGRLNDDGPVGIRALIEVKPNIWDTKADLPDEMKDCVPIRPKDSWKKLSTEML